MPTRKDWDRVKDALRTLYLEEQLSLKEVRNILESEYDFQACPRAYKLKFAAWGWQKRTEIDPVITTSVVRSGGVKTVLDVHAGPSFTCMGSTPAEKDAFHQFWKHATMDLTRYFDSDLWSHIVLQMAHSEDAVRGCLIAYGAAHKAYLCMHGGQEKLFASSPDLKHSPLQSPSPLPSPSPSRHSSSPDPSVPLSSLKHYATALRQVQSRLVSSTTPGHTPEVALICCLLFTLVELVHGSTLNASRHLDSGISLLRSLPPSTDPHPLRPILLRIFTALDAAASVQLLGRPLRLLPPPSQSPDLHSRFLSPTHASDTLDAIIQLDLHFLTTNHLHGPGALWHPPDRIGPLLPERNRLLALHAQWRVRFSLLDHAQLNAKSRRACLLLQARELGLRIMLRPRWDAANSASYRIPGCADLFSTLLDRLEDVTLTATTAAPPVFAVEMGVTPLLAVVAFKCPDKQLWERGQRLLRMQGGREAMWDAEEVERLAAMSWEGETRGESVKLDVLEEGVWKEEMLGGLKLVDEV